MDLRLSPEERAFRDEVRAFFRDHLPRESQRRAWRGQFLQKEDYVAWNRILAGKGWVAPEWPREWGGTGWSAAQLYIFAEEMHRAYAPQQRAQNINQSGNTIAVFGTRAERLPDDYQRYLVNGLRETFGLPGTPIRLQLRGTKNPFAES